MTGDVRVAIAIATTGRKAILTELLHEIRRQTRRPDLVAICPAHDDDIDCSVVTSLGLPILLAHSALGACAQRNALLRDMPEVDIVLFLDDDFFPAPDYVAELVDLFARYPEVALATGTPIADGATGPGIGMAEARGLIAETSAAAGEQIAGISCGYGCNMAVRFPLVAANTIRFDENLPLYSWAEDLEFSHQVARFGRLVRSSRLRGVHLGTKVGRTSDLRFGYSQIANQVYLQRKGVISRRLALRRASRNVLANLRGMIRRESYIDRRGRLVGNLYGLADLIRGRSSPQRILDL